MNQAEERLWRLAVAVEAAERGGRIEQAKELRNRFNKRGKCEAERCEGHSARRAKIEHPTA